MIIGLGGGGIDVDRVVDGDDVKFYYDESLRKIECFYLDCMCF